MLRGQLFPRDGHKAILNKMNNKSKTNRKHTNIDNKNKPQQKHRLGKVSNKLLAGLNRVYARTTLTLNFAVVHIHTTYSVRIKDILLINESKQQTYKSRFITEMKQDEYSIARPTPKRSSKRNPSVEPRWAPPKTDYQAPTNIVKCFSLEPSLSLRAWPAGV